MHVQLVSSQSWAWRGKLDQSQLNADVCWFFGRLIQINFALWGVPAPHICIIGSMASCNPLVWSSGFSKGSSPPLRSIHTPRTLCFLNNSLFGPGHLMLHILLVFTTLSGRYHHPTLSLHTMFRLTVSLFSHWPHLHFLTNHILLGHPKRKITLQNVSRKSCKNSEVFIYPERRHCHLGKKGRPTLILTSLPVFYANISRGSEPPSLSSFHHLPSSLSRTWARLRWWQRKARVLGFMGSALHFTCATVPTNLVIQIQSLGSRVADLLKQRKIMFTF